jgi:hypothetical protein
LISYRDIDAAPAFIRSAILTYRRAICDLDIEPGKQPRRSALRAWLVRPRYDSGHALNAI